MKYEHVLTFAVEHPWAVTEPMRAVIANILSRRILGDEVSAAEIAAALVNRKNLPQPGAGGAVAIIPIYGVIAPRINMMSDMSGGTTFETLSQQLKEAMANKAVKSIVLDVDSPGGNVAGATEFAREVMAARTKKPIVAQAQYVMASAAYWVGACATEICASPSARVGSIGVYTVHDDISEALAKVGIKRTYFSAGKHKVDGNEATPLTKDVSAQIDAVVAEAYAQFVGDVSKGRGVPIADVKAGYGEGKTVSADEALNLGMIDRIATLEDTVTRLQTAAPGAAAAASASTRDTSQERLGATDQDLESDTHFHNRVTARLLELSR